MSGGRIVLLVLAILAGVALLILGVCAIAIMRS